MLVCNSGKVYLEPEQKEALIKFIENAPPYKGEYHHKECTIVCLGYDLPIGAITPDTQIVEQLSDQTYNFHTPLATNNLGYARIWYTIDTGEGPKHGSALSPEWFKLIEGAKLKVLKKRPPKMSPQVSAFFDRMKAEHRDQETEKSKPTVVEPAKDEDETRDKSEDGKEAPDKSPRDKDKKGK